MFAMFKANREIKMFEEITINYGGEYFRGSGVNPIKCLCPAKVHVTDPGYR